MMKKEELEKMVKQIEELEKVDSGGDGKFVVMHNHQMLIRIDHYESIKGRCLDLEKQVKELSGEEGVLVQEKSLKVVEAELEHIRKNLSLIAEGKEIEEVVDAALTPRKRRSSQSD